MEPGEPVTVTLVTVENLQGYVPDRYLGLVQALAASAAEASKALEVRALARARRAYAEAVRGRASAAGIYVVLGLRMAAGINASGQPVWVAYGTLVRGHRVAKSVPAQLPQIE
jgi:hypothetical protein